MRFNGKLIENVSKFREFAKKVERDVAPPNVEKFKVELKDVKGFLKGLKVSGVDGSQISPLKDFGLPFGGVQAARITVKHGCGEFDLKYKSGIAHESNLELERFKLEMEMVREAMDSETHIFYDGSFSVFYTSDMSERLRREYTKEVENVIKLSEETETPIIAYVDRSYSRDLQLGTFDAYVLKSYLGLFEYTEPLKTRSPLCFVYFKVTPTLPVRVEFPEWMKNDVHELMKVVLAECLISSTAGYPYILERAHKYAVISEREKEEFVRAVGVKDVSYKFVSKVIR